MELKIFDVEHGACALLTCDNGARVMIDCGHNATTGWRPGSYLRQQGVQHLDMLVVTNYDEDHVSGLPDLRAKVAINRLWRNKLSFIAHFKLNGIGFLFPGDLETKGWDTLLSRDQRFRAAVSDTKVLIASHHGRESGLCPDMFTKYGCKPYWVVISDKGYQYDTQKTVPFYASHAIGAAFRGEERKVLTTRNDGRIRFWFNNGRWGAD